MRGRIFGYKVETPCPRCNTPRVGCDCDDDYYVVPGILHPARPATCKFSGWQKCANGWKGVSGWDLAYSRTKPTACPKCGGPIEERQITITEKDRYQRKLKRTITALVCPDAIPVPATVEELDGCPECVKTFSI